MVSETAAVSDGRSFAAQIAARVLPQSFAMSHSRASPAIWRTSSVTPVSTCCAVCSTEHRWRSVSGVSRSHAPSAVTVSVSPRSPTVCARTDSDGRRPGTCFDAGKSQRQDTLHTAKALFIVETEHLHRGGDLQSLFGRTHAAAYRIRTDNMRDMRCGLDAFDGFGRKRLRLRAAVQADTVLLGFQQGARAIKICNAMRV